MKMKRIIIPALFGIIYFASICAGEETADCFPSAFLREQTYAFESVVEGSEVIHNFILQNKGNETLFIENVKAG